MPSQYGADYSRFFTPVPGEEAWIPFRHPINDGQKQANARARAARAGTDIGSGYLNPGSGELQDPDRGFGRAILSRPEIMIPLVLGSGFAVGSLGAPMASQAAANATAGGVIPSSQIPTSLAMNAVPGSVGATSAALGGAAPAAAAAGGSAATRGVLGHLKDSLTDPSTYANALPAIIAALSGMGGGGGNSGSEELRRINAITEAQMRRADPLHQTAVNLAFGRMPISSRQGVTLNNVPLPPGA